MLKIIRAKAFRWTLTGMLFALITAIVLLFAFRNQLLRYGLDKAKSRLQNRYMLHLEVQDASFEGLSNISLQHISLVPAQSVDTILVVNEVKAHVRFWPLLTGRLSLSELSVNNAGLQVIRRDSTTNLDALFRRKPQQEQEKQDPSPQQDLEQGLKKILKELSGIIPEQINLQQLWFTFSNNGQRVTVRVPETTLAEERFFSRFNIIEDSLQQQGTIQGSLDDKEWNASFRLFGEHGRRLQIPYVLQRYGLYMAFDTLRLELRGFDTRDGMLELKGLSAVDSMVVWHKRLSSKDIIFEKLSLDFNFQVGSDFIALDSTSVATVNKISLNPYIRYQRRPTVAYTIRANSPAWAAADFFASLPAGMFENVNGLEAEGSLSYSLNFHLEDQDPWNCVFDSELKQENFRILKYGAANLTKLNAAFVYTPFEYGKPMREILVGEANPNFVPLDQISPFLKSAILSAEDPSFFHHRGFIEEAFRQSIARNYVTRRFARGGSTISMQLVKNVFLSREKTVSRKAEEALLVWLIEKNRLSSKERMFEVYLNIIEFGPNVYGIGEAAHFYFGKHPSRLNLAESIWLSAIVPRPKGFRYTFKEDGSLKDYLTKYYRNMADRMVRKELIQAADTFNLKPAVTLNGPARKMVLPEDTAVNNPVLIDDIPLFWE